MLEVTPEHITDLATLTCAEHRPCVLSCLQENHQFRVYAIIELFEQIIFWKRKRVKSVNVVSPCSLHARENQTP